MNRSPPHDWWHLPLSRRQLAVFGLNPRRVCRACGLVQESRAIRYTKRPSQSGYRWEPLVRLCRGKGD